MRTARSPSLTEPRRAARLALSAGLLLLLAPLARPHGGQMVVPRLPATTGVSAPGGAATLAGDHSGPLDGWDLWWELQRDRFVDLDAYFGGSERTSGSGGLLSGHGRLADGRPEAPTRTVVTRRIVPALLDLAAYETEPEVLDATALALGRCARGRDDGASLDALRRLLRHEQPSVAAAAALGLGVSGSPRAVDWLRASLTSGAPEVAAFAALGLGLLDEPRAVHALLQVAVDRDASRDARACALRGLGLLDPSQAHADLARALLVPLFEDRALDPRLRAHAAAAAGRLGGDDVVAALLRGLAERTGDPLVRSGAALGLGAGADPGDVEVVDLLTRLARQELTPVVRHRVLVALGELGRRDRGHADTAAEHGRIVGALVRELRRGGRSGNRAWSGLAAALAAGNRPGLHGLVRERVLEAHDDERDPGTRAALGLALGLLGADEAGPRLVSAFRLAQDDGERGYAAVALGLLRHGPAAPHLQQLMRLPDARPLVRLRCATGLALLGDHGAAPSLLALLDSPVPGAAESAASALGLLGDGAAVAPLLARLGQGPDELLASGGSAVGSASDQAAASSDPAGAAVAGEPRDPDGPGGADLAGARSAATPDPGAVRRRAFAVVALGLLGERALFPGEPSALARLRAHVDPRSQVPALLAAWSVL